MGRIGSGPRVVRSKSIDHSVMRENARDKKARGVGQLPSLGIAIRLPVSCSWRSGLASSNEGKWLVKPIAEMSPRFKARIAGFMYLLIFVTAPSGAATATPMKMLVNLASDTGVALMFFYLFQPVSRRLSFLASLCRIIFVVIMSVNSLNYFGAIEFLQPPHSSASFNSGYGIALIPFGVHCVSRAT